RQLASSSLAEIVAQQWLVTNQTIIDDLRALPQERWCSIEYDTLLADTAGQLRRLCQFADVVFGPRLHQIAANPLKPSKYTLSAPQKDKWKRNEAELQPVIASTEELMTRLHALESS
ncbi:MAG: hypothetical protein KJP04_10120, partial [Arenicella sp.]|nr:hypothetical protein [Arenicella sp.]